MLTIRSLVQILPRRMMSSSSSSGSGRGSKKNQTPLEQWKEEEKKARDALAKSSHDDHHQDPNDDPFSGQTKINFNHDAVGFKQSSTSADTYFNPLLTPPPRSPSTPEDFKHPVRLGHWTSLGYDYINPVADKYYFHEFLLFAVGGLIIGLWGYFYAPDVKDMEWARREAFLRTAKREALGLPLIDRNLVDPERIVLPTEEELEDFRVVM